jgi:HlyD family secretion protein
MSMRRRGRWLWSIVLVVLLGGAFVAYRLSLREAAPQYKTTTVERGKIAARVTATGVLSALVTVQVGSQVSGRIQEIHADFNSEVKKGQQIAKIDPQLFEAAMEQSRANHLAAAAALNKSKAQAIEAGRQYDRAKALFERRLNAQADLDAAETAKRAAEADVELQESSVAQAKAAHHQAEVNLGYTNIVSPINGVVISRNVDVGQTVAASLQAPTLFTIAEDLKKMQVDTNVAEADVGKLSAGMTAQFRVDSYPTETFSGRIRQIRNAPQTVQNVVTYDAVIDVDNAELRLKPGMTANVTVVYDQRDDVLKIPNTALRFKPTAEMIAAGKQGPWPQNAEAAPVETSTQTEAGSRTIWRKKGMAIAPVHIRTGLSDGASTEIVSGPIQSGDQVVIEAKASANGATSGATGGPPRGRLF